MEETFAQLKKILAEVADLEHAAALLDWDQQTYMPPGGIEARSNQLGTLRGLAHQKFISEEVGQRVEDLEPLLEELGDDSDQARLLRVTKREYDKQTRVPSEFVSEFSRVTAAAHGAWIEARKTDDFAHVQPHLEKIVSLWRQYADYFAPYDHVYDPLLDDFEPGMKTAAVQEIFTELRPKQVALLQAIEDKPQVDDSFLHLQYEEQGQ